MVITSELIPRAVMCGLSYEDAWDATPVEISLVVESWYKARTVSAWLDGQYVLAAIGCSFSKSGRYPDNPLDAIENMVDPDMVLTEEEEEYYRKLLMGNLGRMFKNNEEE